MRRGAARARRPPAAAAVAARDTQILHRIRLAVDVNQPFSSLNWKYVKFTYDLNIDDIDFYSKEIDTLFPVLFLI